MTKMLRSLLVPALRLVTPLAKISRSQREPVTTRSPLGLMIPFTGAGGDFQWNDIVNTAAGDDTIVYDYGNISATTTSQTLRSTLVLVLTQLPRVPTLITVQQQHRCYLHNQCR